MCGDGDQSLIAVGMVLLSVLGFLSALRVWVALCDYLLRRRVTLRGALGQRYREFEERVFEKLTGLK